MRVSILLIVLALQGCSTFFKSAEPLPLKNLKNAGSGLTNKDLEANLKQTSFMRFGNYQFHFTLLSADYIRQSQNPLIAKATPGECVMMELELIAVEKKNRNFDRWNVYQKLSKKDKIKLKLVAQNTGKLIREQRGSSPNYVWYQDAVYCGNLMHKSNRYNFLVTLNLDKKMDPKEAYTSFINYKFPTNLEKQGTKKQKTALSKKYKNARKIFRQRTRKELAGEEEAE